jgi:threonine dehydratase
MPIPTAIDLLTQVVDKFVSVDDDQIAEATRMLLDTAGIVAEPSGAAGVAALMQRLDFKGLEVASVITGSNLDPQLYARIFASR